MQDETGLFLKYKAALGVLRGFNQKKCQNPIL
jgi:hypothetical protein